MKPQGCGCCDFDGPETLATPARNNYFYGKLLDEQHFRLEQRDFNNKRWLLNRLAVGEGVFCGLGLKPTADGRLVALARALRPTGWDVRSSCRPLQYSIRASSPTPAASRRVRLALARSLSGWPITPALPSLCQFWFLTASPRRAAPRVPFASLSPSWSVRAHRQPPRRHGRRPPSSSRHPASLVSRRATSLPRSSRGSTRPVANLQSPSTRPCSLDRLPSPRIPRPR